MTLHLAIGHPLAAVAAGHCATHSAPLIGGVACGPCWERAIRDDERFAVENVFPRDLDSDCELVDDVAVERAIQGHAVALNRLERLAAIAQLRDSGATTQEIARLLRSSHTTVVRELQQLPRPEQPHAHRPRITDPGPCAEVVAARRRQ